jgi:CheY-like chemotaxis protein
MNIAPVLYAEDEETDSFLLTRAFKKANVSTPLIIVPNGQEAIDYCAGNGGYANREEFPLPGLVLLDLNMPRKSGIEVLRWIRERGAVGLVPVIILTSSLQDDDIHRAYVAGANAYLGKPSQPDELLTMVKALRDFWLDLNRSAEHR